VESARRLDEDGCEGDDATETFLMPWNPAPCSYPRCPNSATYKIAAPWSYGAISELKTYALSCAEHFSTLFREAQERKILYPPSSDETVGEIGIYRCGPWHVDDRPRRLAGLEASCHSWERAMQAAGSQP
jgi:hypothetical protein